MIEESDFIAQSNKSPHDDNIDEINSGFMLLDQIKVLRYINLIGFLWKNFQNLNFMIKHTLTRLSQNSIISC